jgi:hypothetical protein
MPLLERMLGDFTREFCAGLFATIETGSANCAQIKACTWRCQVKSWPEGHFRADASSFFMSARPEAALVIIGKQ